MDNCTLDCIQIVGQLDYSQMCTFTQNQCHQDTIQFVQSYFCLFHGSFIMLILLGIPFFLLLFKTLNIIAQEYLSPCVQEFIYEFKISPTIAGVTFLAFANGAPDVMTAIIAGSSDSTSTALIPFGSIFGACIFSTAFILSAVILAQPSQKISLKMSQFILPLSFYIIAIIFIIIITTTYGEMNLYIAGILLLLYGIYIVLVLKFDKKSENKQSLISTEEITEKDEQGEEINSSSIIQSQLQENQNQRQGKREKKKLRIFFAINQFIEDWQNALLKKIIPFYKIDQWNPLNTIISLAISPFIIASTQSMPEIFTKLIGPIPIFLLISLPALLLLAYTIYCAVKYQQPYYMKPFTVYSFFVAISALTVVCSILINFVQLVQILTGMNSVFLGLTVFAGANSIGDYLTITHFAKQGNAKTAIAGIFSGQLFNFLIGFGVSLMIQSIDGPYPYKIFDFEGTAYDKISDSIVMTVISGGLIYLVYLLIISIVKRGVFVKKEAIFGRFYYIGFIIIATFLSILTDYFHIPSCDIL